MPKKLKKKVLKRRKKKAWEEIPVPPEDPGNDGDIHAGDNMFFSPPPNTHTRAVGSWGT